MPGRTGGDTRHGPCGRDYIRARAGRINYVRTLLFPAFCRLEIAMCDFGDELSDGEEERETSLWALEPCLRMRRDRQQVVESLALHYCEHVRRAQPKSLRTVVRLTWRLSVEEYEDWDWELNSD